MNCERLWYITGTLFYRTLEASAICADFFAIMTTLCNDFQRGDDLIKRKVLLTTLARQCTRCNLTMALSAISWKCELQFSSLIPINVRTIVLAVYL